MKAIAFAVILALISPATFGAGERLTQRCSAPPATKVAMEVTGEARQAITAVVANPSSNPVLYEQLWRPASTSRHFTNDNKLVLDYPGPLDPVEIAASIAGNVDLGRLGVSLALPSTNGLGNVCFGTMPPAPKVTLTEFLHPGLGHYFLSSSESETQAILAGAAGAGWQLTGESFLTTVPDACYSMQPVFRFYGPRQNSHFFSVDAAECGAVRRMDPGWQYEGIAFGATMPVNGACTAGQPVFRLYNNHAAQNDSNHRFTVKTSIRDEMVARGWIFEGIAMCLYPHPTVP
jgi:hypothetical protein